MLALGLSLPTVMAWNVGILRARLASVSGTSWGQRAGMGINSESFWEPGWFVQSVVKSRAQVYTAVPGTLGGWQWHTEGKGCPWMTEQEALGSALLLVVCLAHAGEPGAALSEASFLHVCWDCGVETLPWARDPLC